MKKALRLLLLALIGTLCAILLISCGCEEGSKLDFELSSNKSYYIVTGIGEHNGACLTIPDTHEGLPVSAIGERAFANNEKITEITIPEGISVIGDNAFANCPNVTVVNYNAQQVSDAPSVYTRIFSSLGKSTSGVTVNIGKNVVSIPSLLFYQDEVENANNITSVRVADSSALTSISHGAFGNLPNLKDISFGQDSKLKVLGNGVFEYCSSLTSIKIPSSVVEIGSGAFYECTSLSAVEIESIDAWCGIKLSNATSNPAYYSHALTLGGSVITSLVIPEGVSEIGDFTFSYNTALRSVSIPSSVTSIGKFEDCTSLCEIVYNAKNATCVSSPFERAGNASDKIKVIIGASTEVLPKEIFSNNAHITALDMSGASALTEIGEKAFSGAQNLEGVTSIPATVKKIGLSAFDDCEKILVFEDGVYYIGAWAVSRTNSVPVNLTLREGTVGIAQGVFYNCVSLQNLTLPASLKAIGVASFRSCPSLKVVNLVEGSSLVSVGAAAFWDCASLVRINIHSQNDWARINFEGSNANPLTKGSEVGLYLDGQKITELDISDIDEIGTYAFKDYTALTRVSLLVNKKIGANAFEGCTAITHLSLSSTSDIVIEDNAFFNLKTLSTLDYDLKGVSVGDIYNGVFYKAGIDSVLGITVHVGKGVQSMSDSLFKTKSGDTAPNIRNVYFSKDGALKSVPSGFSGISSIQLVSIPEGFTSLGSRCFSGCTGISSITLPSTITEIGAGAFEGSSLTQIILPEGLTKIGSSAFASTKITSIEFPTTLKVIGPNAFYKCVALSTVGAFPSALAEIGDLAFYESAITGAITIPKSVTSLGYGAFIRTKITEAHISGAVTNLGARIFEGCASLTAVELPEGIISLEGRAFNGCSSLKSITLPASLKSIGVGAFEGCSALESVTFTSSEGWSASNGEEAFSINPNLASSNATYLVDTYKGYTWTRQ